MGYLQNEAFLYILPQFIIIYNSQAQ